MSWAALRPQVAEPLKPHAPQNQTYILHRSFLTSNHPPVLRAPPVPAFYDYIKSVGGGLVNQRPFNVSKRALLLYDDDTTLDFDLVCTLFLHDKSSSFYPYAVLQLKAAINSLHGELHELVAMKLQGLTRQQVMQVIHFRLRLPLASWVLDMPLGLSIFDPKFVMQAYSEASVIVDLWLPGKLPNIRPRCFAVWFSEGNLLSCRC